MPIEIEDTLTYRLVRKIAEGGMGTVYEALQIGSQGFQKSVAIKMILEELAQDPEFTEMFIGEARLAADLVHQNIVQIYNLGKVGNSYYMAMEYCNGTNLDEFVQRHKELGIQVPFEMVAFIISRICRGLEYAHSKQDSEGRLLGVVHRDISPKNILLTMEGVVKLNDFGIAKAGHLLNPREGDVLYGKVQYMSPEQAQYQRTDRRSDIFSLGIVFYELLTSSDLFDAEDTMRTLRKLIHDDLPEVETRRPDAPEELSRILGIALARRPEDRYMDAGSMGQELERFMYHDRYGPTNVTLAEYISRLFPSKASLVRRTKSAPARVSKRFQKLPNGEVEDED